MAKTKKVLSIVFTFVFTMFTMLCSMPVQAGVKKTVVPEVQFASAPVTEYTAGDRVQFNINAPNFGGKVEYRVVLWEDSKKSYSDLWNAGNGYPNCYYTKWQPTGNTIFTLGWPILEPGNYRITVYAKRVGVASSKAALIGMNCDSYKQSVAFTVKPKVTLLDKEGQIYGSNDANKLETYKGDTKITANNVVLGNAKVEGDLYILGDNAVIKNVSATGKVVVDPGKDGSTTLENVTAKNIEVLSGGQNSIHIKNVQADSMDVSSTTPVRIEADGDTEIVSTSATGCVIFDRKSGTYGTITITEGSNGTPVIEFRGEIKDKVEVETTATIKTSEASKISNLVINTEKVTDTVKLEGQYGKVEVAKEAKVEIGETAVITDSLKVSAKAEIKADEKADVKKVDISTVTNETVKLEGRFQKVEINSQAKVEVGANTKIESIVANTNAEINLDKTAVVDKVDKGSNNVAVGGEGQVGPSAPPVADGSQDIPPVYTTIGVSGITVTPATMTLTAGGATGTIIKTINPANATNQNVTWSSSNTSVATVVNGVVTPVAQGTATITVTAAADNTKIATCAVTVNAATVTVGFLPNYLAVFEQNVNYMHFEVSGELTGLINTSKLKFMASQTGENYYYLSDNYLRVESIAALSPGQYGYIKDGGNNTVVCLKLTDNDANKIKSLQGYGNGNILAAENDWYPDGNTGVKNVYFCNLISIKNNSSHIINSMHAFDENDTEISYESAEPGYGPGSETTVTAAAQATRIVFYEGESTYNVTPTNGKMNIVQVTADLITNGITIDDNGWIDVNESNFGKIETQVAVSGITVTPATMTLTAGGATGTITKTISPANATNQNVTWSTSNPSVATVVNGVVTPVAQGTAVITVTTVDGEFKASTNITVEETSVDNIGAYVTALDYVNETTIKVIFDEELEETSAETIANYTLSGSFGLKGSPIAAVLGGTENNEVTLTVGDMSSITDGDTVVVTVADVSDLAGNPVDANNNSASFIVDNIGAYVTALDYVDVTTIKVIFDEELDKASAETVTNYILDGTFGLTGNPSAAVLGGTENNEVTLTVGSMSSITDGDTVGVTAANVLDLAGNSVDANNNSASFIVDNIGAYVIALDYVDKTTIKVIFDEELDKTSAEIIANYTLGGTFGLMGNPSAAVLGGTGNNEVTLTVGDMSGILNEQTVIVTVSNVLDLAGNPVDANKNSATCKIISSDARLISIEEITDETPGTSSGDDATHPIEWEVSYENTTSALGTIFIEVSADATSNLYSDSSFTTEITDVLNLAVGDTMAYIKVTAQDKVTVKYYAVTITRKALSPEQAALLQAVEDAVAELEAAIDTEDLTVRENYLAAKNLLTKAFNAEKAASDEGIEMSDDILNSLMLADAIVVEAGSLFEAEDALTELEAAIDTEDLTIEANLLAAEALLSTAKDAVDAALAFTGVNLTTRLATSEGKVKEARTAFDNK